MKRIIHSTSELSVDDFASTIFIDKTDRKVFDSIASYINWRTHTHYSGYRTVTNLYEYRVNGMFTGLQDGIEYVVIKDKHIKVMRLSNFYKNYIALDSNKFNKYQELLTRWVQECGGTYEAQKKSKDDIVQWLSEISISEFSAVSE